MSAYDERPWLAQYGDQPADYTLEFDDALTMFRAGVARDPDAVALRYFDGVLTRQELDELSDALASGLLASGFAAGDRLAVYLQNVPQFVIAMVAAWKAGGQPVAELVQFLPGDHAVEVPQGDGGGVLRHPGPEHVEGVVELDVVVRWLVAVQRQPRALVVGAHRSAYLMTTGLTGVPAALATFSGAAT